MSSFRISLNKSHEPVAVKYDGWERKEPRAHNECKGGPKCERRAPEPFFFSFSNQNSYILIYIERGFWSNCSSMRERESLKSKLEKRRSLYLMHGSICPRLFFSVNAGIHVAWLDLPTLGPWILVAVGCRWLLLSCVKWIKESRLVLDSTHLFSHGGRVCEGGRSARNVFAKMPTRM